MNEAEIFERISELADHQQRQSLIEELCANDSNMRQRIEQLLARHEQQNTFLNDPVGIQQQRVDTTTTPPRIEFPANGSQVGPYKLLQEIGEGGMGLVFMAEQTEPVRRRVALKIIKPGMDSRQVVARFEAERQALAMMDHPNIAKVFDAGTTDDGRPYFVMELVNGKPITDYCDEEKLTTELRLKLFTSVCRAVQHAHQKGIIHRDLKPNNILVAEFDGEPVAKVIDFGIAKATGQQLTDKTLFTEFGQVVGTIEYMSPEQARRNQLDIDTRSDIYSLGVVLYKLLTGETPFGSERLKKVAWDEILKIIREELPDRPSIKVGSSAALEQIARDRSVSAARLPSQIRGDLDWIVTKSLEKNREQRYQTASELADDLVRHLNAETVLAAPANSLDRVSKMVRRNPKTVRAIVAAAFLIGLAVFLGLRASNQLKSRNARLLASVRSAQSALEQAISSDISVSNTWQTVEARTERINDLLDSDSYFSRKIRKEADEFIRLYELKKSEREIAIQIEDVVIRGASDKSRQSWQSMELEMREFFKKHGFDLDSEDPMTIAQKIQSSHSSVMWVDLLELWLGAKGQLGMIGGQKFDMDAAKPWADAMYAADKDPVRTAIRKFMYNPPPNRDQLDKVVGQVDIETLSPRTISWLGSCYAIVGDIDECNRVFQIGLIQYPRDVMLAHDYGYGLTYQKRYQEAARMFHRCLVLRDDVPGLWISLASTLKALGETEAAEKASRRAAELSQSQQPN